MTRTWIALPLLASCVVEPWGALGSLEVETIATELAPTRGAMTDDPTNAQAASAAAAALGHQLFFDPRYSKDGTISCASCHIASAGFQDDRANTSLGLDYTGRHALSCLHGGAAVDAAGTAWQFWDGRRDSLWSQALGPPESDTEMGGTRSGVALLVYDRYREPYEAIFGPMPELRDEDGVPLIPVDAKPGTASWELLDQAERDAIDSVYVGFGKAIDAYEPRLSSTNSPFDRFWDDATAGDGVESTALTPEQKRGLSLFIGKANCVECHNGPELSDGEFHNIGVAQEGPHVPAVDEGRAAGIAAVLADEFNCASRWSDHPDKSQCAVATVVASDATLGGFKTPSLREVATTAPYMHTGALTTLDEVVRFYNAGGGTGSFSGERDPEILPLGLIEPEIADLVAFLESLTGEALPAELTTAPPLP
jgi:cytochrome c peroxidase